MLFLSLMVWKARNNIHGVSQVRLNTFIYSDDFTDKTTVLKICLTVYNVSAPTTLL